MDVFLDFETNFSFFTIQGLFISTMHKSASFPIERLPLLIFRILAGLDNLPSNAGLTNQVADNTFNYFKPGDNSNGGNMYTIKILIDKNSPGFAPRRYAVVENENGVVVLRGPASFSSSTKILVDEIKFRINNQLP